MSKNAIYSVFCCTLAYLAGAALLLVIWLFQNGWGGLGGDTATFIVTGLTMKLSEFTWWGDFPYLAVIVPWLGSVLVLTFLMAIVYADTGIRQVLGGLSVFIYYLVMVIVFIAQGFIGGWGDIAYGLFPVWAVAGFTLGYLMTAVIEKVVNPQF